MKESDIDDVIDGLNGLRDGKNDSLGKMLQSAIVMLKEYRKARALWRKLRAQTRQLKQDHEKAAKELEAHRALFKK